MSRLTQTLTDLRTRREGAFMPFLVLGDPDAETSLELAGALVEGGADVLEFGMAFSDPPADGPVIQAADLRALRAGMTPPLAFELLDEIHRRWQKPAALLVYYNLVMQYGVDAFYARARGAGVDAVLVADLPLEEARPAIAAARAHDVAPVFIVSELSSDERIESLAAVAGGYLYVTVRVGITGEQQAVNPALPATCARARRHSPLPLLAGFGISTPDHVRAVLAAGADGAICGSALVKKIAEHRAERPAMLAAVRDLARQLKEATC